MTQYERVRQIGLCCICIVSVNCGVYALDMGTWVKQTPTEANGLIEREDNDVDDDGHVSWSMTTTSTGKKADATMSMITTCESSLKQASKNITCSRTEQYKALLHFGGSHGRDSCRSLRNR